MVGVGLRWTQRSLAPGRGLSRSPVEVAALLGTSALRAAVTSALLEIAAAVDAAFPGNIFWDLESTAATLVRAGEGGGERALVALGRRLAALQGLYGQATTIRFRYVHDFVYGFDWAKWVRREPTARAGVGPLDEPFLDHMERRAEELRRLIEDDDDTYPRLPAGQARNPFGFSREPAAECLLMQDLAGHGLIPVEAWDLEARPQWDRPYADLRAERARELGLPTRAP